jgi:RHS repeat-associated protein
MVSHLGRTTYQYDAGNRVTQVVDPLQFTTTYTYHADYGVLTSLSLPLDTTKLVRTNTWATLSDGRLTNRLKQIKYQRGSTTVWSGTYTYDLVGNVRTISDATSATTRSYTYTYDEAYRLTEAQGASGNSTHKTSRYSYDKVGNRVTWGNELTSGKIYFYDVSGKNWTVAQTTDANNRVTAMECKYSTITETMRYGYEPNGNLTWESPDLLTPGCPAANTLTETTFDDANRLVHYERDTAYDRYGVSAWTEFDYGYDGDGNRLFAHELGYVWDYAIDGPKLTLSEYTQYQYAGGKVLNERSRDGAPVWYVRDPYGNLLYTLHWRSTNTLKPDAYVLDHLGSIRMIVQYSGTVTNDKTYDAFGIASGTSALRNSYEFTGLPQDAKTGLTYAYARYYKPSFGRFISQDTYKGNIWEPWTQNLYAYVGNNPLNYIDPTGHEAASCLVCDTAELRGMGRSTPTTSKGMQVAAGVFLVGTAAAAVVPQIPAPMPLKRGDSALLADNMKAAGKGARPKCQAAHHIVAGDDARAARSRSILDAFDIDINGAENGVYLPYANSSQGCTDNYHNAIHTDDYYSKVQKLLERAKQQAEEMARRQKLSPEDTASLVRDMLKKALDSIGQQLQSKTW